jgi:hypothetical protein
METKFQQADFHKKLKQIGDFYPNSCIVDCIISTNNRSGGLAMFWTNDVNIDCYIDRSNHDIGLLASGLYGFSSHQQKPQTCDLIKNLFQNITHENWLLFGDFNMVLNHAEKLGGRDLNYSHTNLFQDTLNNCLLQDLGYHGDIFTWSNNQENEHHIKERLDRFCASSSWLTRFPRVTNYHYPILALIITPFC